MALVWFLVQRRALGHIRHLEAVAARLEVQLKIQTEYTLSVRLNKADHQNYLARGPAARSVMTACVLITGISWLVALGYSVCRALR